MDFLNTVEDSHYLTVAINKFQRSRVTFDFSAKVSLESRQYIKT